MANSWFEEHRPVTLFLKPEEKNAWLERAKSLGYTIDSQKFSIGQYVRDSVNLSNRVVDGLVEGTKSKDTIGEAVEGLIQESKDSTPKKVIVEGFPDSLKYLPTDWVKEAEKENKSVIEFIVFYAKKGLNGTKNDYELVKENQKLKKEVDDLKWKVEKLKDDMEIRDKIKPIDVPVYETRIYAILSKEGKTLNDEGLLKALDVTPGDLNEIDKVFHDVNFLLSINAISRKNNRWAMTKENIENYDRYCEKYEKEDEELFKKSLKDR